MIACPPDSELEQFLHEALAPERGRLIEAHLERCETCRRALACLVRAAPAGPPHGEPHLQEDLLARLAEAPPTGPYLHPAPADARPGPASLPRYEVIEELGRGGMGVVYKARQLGLNRVVALKMVRAGGHAGDDALARFRAEAEAVARLQHPNIVQVFEVGEHDRCPFFSMEFCTGGSLKQSLGGTPLAPEPAARVTEVLARAAHAAHARGVVHRDLKPANILLAEDGTPKIADFGLAKILGPDSVQTCPGQILGTPSYMAPEQAAGRPHAVGPAADVWALGAIFYELLTGRPPFRAATPLGTLEQVRTQEPVPPQRLCPGVGRDLETICLKCLEKDPRKRYRSALELADDLRRFLAGEPIMARPVGPVERAAKWVRRRPAVAALAALAALFVLSLAGGGLWFGGYEHERAEEANRLRRAADVEREAAERHLRLTRKALAEYTQLLVTLRGDAGPDAGLLEGHRVAVQLHEELGKKGDDTFSSRIERGKTYGRLAEVTAEVASEPEAIRRYEQARDEFNKLLRQGPEDRDLLRALAVTENNLGTLYRKAGQPGPAQKAYLNARAIRQRLLQADPADVDAADALAGIHSNLGNLFANLGHDKDAEAALRESLMLLERLHKSRPDVVAYRLSLAGTCGNLAVLCRRLGQWHEAERLFNKALSLRRGLAREFPARPEYRQHLASSLINLGNWYTDFNQPGKAEKAFQEAITVQEGLIKSRPAVAAYRFDLAQSCNNVAVLYARLGGEGEKKAEDYLLRAAGLGEALASKHPSVKRYRAELSAAYNNLGMVYARRRDVARAERNYRKALALADELAGEVPGVIDYPEQQARCLVNLGNLLRRTNRRKDAEDCYLKAQAVCSRLTDSRPGDHDLQSELAKILSNLAAFHGEGGDRARAADRYRAALEIRERLAREHAGIPEYKYLLARTLNNLGVFHFVGKEYREAETPYRRALALREELLRDLPRDHDYLHDLVVSHNNLALLQTAVGAPAAAETSFRTAIQILEQKLLPSSDLPRHRESLAWGRGNLAVLYSQEDRPREAESEYLAAIQLLKRLAREHPAVPRYATSLGLHLVNLGRLVHGHAGPEPSLKWYGEAIQTLEPVLRADETNRTAREQLQKAYAGRERALSQLRREKEAREH